MNKMENVSRTNVDETSWLGGGGRKYIRISYAVKALQSHVRNANLHRFHPLNNLIV